MNNQGSTPLYNERLHVKALLKKILVVVLVAAIGIAYVIFLAVQTKLGGVMIGQRLIHFPPLGLKAAALILLAVILVTGYIVYRFYYEWRHTFIRVTWKKIGVYRASAWWLLLMEAENDEHSTRFVVGFGNSELFFFKNCRTVTIKALDLEGSGQSPIKDMHDVRDYTKLQDVVGKITEANGISA
jgi:hypothetical protein